MNQKNTQLEVRQSNIITHSRHELSATQLDLYFMMLSLIRENDEPNKVYQISVKEIESMTGRIWQYNQLQEATEGMIGKVFRIEEHYGLLQVAMLSSAQYLRGKGKIELSIDPKLRPYLINIKNNFYYLLYYDERIIFKKRKTYLVVEGHVSNLTLHQR